MSTGDSGTLERFGLRTSQRQSFGQKLAENTYLGRVVAQHRGEYEVVTDEGVRRAPASPELLKEARRAGRPRPVVGDWVALGRTALCAVFPRTSVLCRKAAGRDDAQQVAANVDTAFVVTGLVGDFSPRRVERFLAMIREGGVRPVVVLAKADLVPTAERKPLIAELSQVLGDAPLLLTSAVTGEGMDELASWARPRDTVALLGSSGVGKSTLLNRLLGEERQATQCVRSNGKGRHTTVQRELVPLPTGAVLLDNPGIRELGLWNADEGLAEAFHDIEAVAQECRFRDCRHEQDAGCALRSAVTEGRLHQVRLESYLKLRRELDELRSRVETGRPNPGRADARRESRSSTRARIR